VYAAVINVPAILAVGTSATGKGGHAASKRRPWN
jgi:hypothetical protein